MARIEGKRGQYRRQALTVALGLALGLAQVPLASTARAQATPTQQYALPSQPLGSALNRLAMTADRQLLAPPELVRGRTAPALSGRYTVEEALGRLLAGSGLTYRVDARGVITIHRDAERPATPAPTLGTPPAQPAVDNEPAVTELERMVVTGSHIRRNNLEGPSPVTVITRQDLDRSGQSTVAEALAQLPQNFASPISVGFGGNGTQSVNLRGLGTDNTLVLVNGRRIASSGASANSSFVDLGSITLAAVERIEVLTDGASALYGSDAVTGVVNLILKQDFQGSEVSVGYGDSVEGGASERQVNFTTGWSKGGFNALVSAEYFKRERLAATDRAFSRTDDLRDRGGMDRRLTFANPGNVSSVDGQNLPGLDAPSAGNPAGQDGRGLTPGDFAATAGQLNRESFVAGYNDLIPESERFGVSSRMDVALGERLTLFAEAGASRNRTGNFYSSPLASIVVPETNPFNPFGVPVRVSWLATELRAQREYESDNRRVLAGLEGRLGESWYWETSVGYSRDEYDERFAPASVAGAVVSALVNRTDPATALNVFGDGEGANSAAVLAELGFGRSLTSGAWDVLAVAGKADGTVLHWAGRDLRAAVGWEYREEDFESVRQDFQTDPDVPNIVLPVSGGREVMAGFVELALPLFGEERASGSRTLELQAAARFEHYSDFGETTNPKLALRWQPFESLVVRGSVGTSFRAPSLRELYGPVTTATGTVVDPQRGNESVAVSRTAGGNRALEPEESLTWNLGLAWDAPFLPSLSLTADAWRLRQEDRITTLTNAELLAAEAIFPGRITRDTPTAEDSAAGRPGRLLAIDVTSLNASETELRGVDIGLKYTRDSAVGRFDLQLAGAYIYHATRQLTPVAPVQELPGTLSGGLVGENADRPESKFRGNLSVFWSRGAWEVGVTERYTGRSRDPFSALHPVVDDHYETDVQLNYAWPGDTGWLAGTRLSLGAVNVFNQEPPFRDAFFGYSTAMHSPRQAFYYLRVTKAF